MAVLTKQDLEKIDEKIDSTITSQELLSRPRDVALIHLLRYFEDYVRLYSPMMAEDQGPLAYSNALKNGQDGMHFAVWWIFQHCPYTRRQPQLITDLDAYLEARKLHEAAMDYARVWDYMAMLRRGRATAESDLDGTIRLRYANQLIADIEVADRLIASPDGPEITRELISQDHDYDPSNLIANIGIRPYGCAGIKYYVPDQTFTSIANEQSRMVSHLWEVDASWDLGGYTVSQFRNFWIALRTLCWIHHWACLLSGVEGVALSSVVRVLQHRRWEHELARRSGLDRSVVAIILEDLIYDPALYGPNKKQPDVTYQPFFPVGSGLLALSNWLVLLSNAERNIWDLVSIKRTSLHSILRNRKENLWLLELSPRLESYGLKAYNGPIYFTHAGKQSDLDLLVLDSRIRLGIGFQIKWLTGPDRIRDIKYTEDELQKGLNQAVLSLQWLNSRSSELQRLTGLAGNELAEYEFKGMVLSKNTIGSGWVHQPDIPIVNERLMHWILDAPHRKNLRTLWRVGEERRYLPIRDRHFRDQDCPVEFGSLRFLGEELGMVLQEPWDPATDIDLTELS